MIDGRLHAVAIVFYMVMGQWESFPNAYIIARKGPHVSVVHLYRWCDLLRMLSMYIYYSFTCCFGFQSHFIFSSLYLGSPPCGSFVHYVGVFNVFYCRFESEGGHGFSNVIVFYRVVVYR